MNRNVNKIISYIVIPALACFSLFVLEQVLLVDYYTKTIAKILLFISIPVSMNFLLKPLKTTAEKSIKSIRHGAGIGIVIIIIIALNYIIFRENIDSTAIVEELSQKSKITKENYPLIGFYITFGNSFLEEFFFRNFIFLNLYRLGWKRMSYISSSLLFSIYHVAIFKTWFSPAIILLSLFGLIVAGFILDFVNTKTNSMLNSWIIHISADIVIIGIGFLWIMG